MRNTFKLIKQSWADFKLGREIRREKASLVKSQQPNANQSPDSQKHRKGWQRQKGQQYPWRIERGVIQDANSRGTWVLEVKHMFDVEWETLRVHDGRRWRWESVPQSHWPFPYVRKEDGKTKKSS